MTDTFDANAGHAIDEVRVSIRYEGRDGWGTLAILLSVVSLVCGGLTFWMRGQELPVAYADSTPPEISRCRLDDTWRLPQGCNHPDGYAPDADMDALEDRARRYVIASGRNAIGQPKTDDITSDQNVGFHTEIGYLGIERQLQADGRNILTVPDVRLDPSITKNERVAMVTAGWGDDSFLPSKDNKPLRFRTLVQRQVDQVNAELMAASIAERDAWESYRGARAVQPWVGPLAIAMTLGALGALFGWLMFWYHRPIWVVLDPHRLRVGQKNLQLEQLSSETTKLVINGQPWMVPTELAQLLQPRLTGASIQVKKLAALLDALASHSNSGADIDDASLRNMEHLLGKDVTRT